MSLDRQPRDNSHIEITRIFGIDCAHRILKHESKCANLHGHRYEFHVTVTAPRLDENGRIIDFGEVKKIVGGWLDNNWDHGTLIDVEDTVLKTFLVEESQKFFVLPYAPSAENIAMFLFYLLPGILPAGIKPRHVRLYETPNCYADFFG